MMADRSARREVRPAPLRLETIDGLGSRFADMLRGVGIHGIAELSDFDSPERLHNHLVAHGVDIPLRRILNERSGKGDWISQARQRNARVWVVDFSADRTTEPPSWTTTVSSEELGVEEHFEGIHPRTWAQWILEQSALEPLPDRDTRPASDTPSAAHTLAGGETRFEIGRFEVSGPHADRGGPIEARIEVLLSGPGAAHVAADRAPAWIGLIALDENTSEPTLLASASVRFSREVLIRSETLVAAVPAVGTYQLCCLASCFQPRMLLEYAEGPQLHVVERGSPSP
jgi:hypothetical protein